MTAAARAAWAAAGALAALAAVGYGAVVWAQRAAETEMYGTAMEPGGPGPYAGMTPLERETAKLADDEARQDRQERYERLRELARADWPGPQVVHDEPLRVEPYRPDEGNT